LALLPALLLPTDVMPEWQGSFLMMEERVAAQRAIEEVYWRHRIWPEHNPGPKPPLSAVMPEAAIRAKVLDYLKKSAALERFWQRPITAAQLQAEIDRMSRGTHDAALLEELFGALGNDPHLIAETLARRTLSERLVRNWYARAELGGEYTEVTYVRRDEGAAAVLPPGSVPLAPDDWLARTEEIANLFGVATAETPLLRPSSLHEDAERFFVVAVLSSTAEAMTVATVSWPKPSFDGWWVAERAGLVAEIQPEPGSFTLSAPEGTPCTDDSWQEMWAVPDPRDTFTAVWTGSELIVWGGLSQGGSFNGDKKNTGGRYDPATDSWTKVSTVGAPTGRAAHTAVWTGTEMIVWGGQTGLAAAPPENTGGRYDPATDSWTKVSTAGAPTGRTAHTAVWTGTEMIVWGGLDSCPRPTAGRRRRELLHLLAASTPPSGQELR
jgi:hypothetical protein